MQPNAGTNQLSSRRTVLRPTKRLPKWQTLRLNTASLPSHWLRLRRDEQHYRAERSRTAYLQLGFASWRKSRDYSLSSNLSGRARPLFLHFSNCLSANGRTSAAASPRHVDHARLRRRSHASSVDRCGRSCTCVHNASSAGNKAPRTTKGGARAVLFRDCTDFEEYSTA